MINDIRNWWLGFGRLELEHWRRGRPQWRSHFPFIKEVFDYDRKTRSWLYDDETGDPSHELRPHEIWVPPEEIIQIRMKLYQ